MNNSLKKNSIYMLGSSIISQILLVITVPIISRLFTPEEYGVFTLFSNIAFLLIPIINGRFDLLIINSVDKKESYIFSKISFIISVILLILVTPVFFLYFKLSNYPLIFVIFLIILLFLVSVNNITSSYFSFLNQYNKVAYINLIRTILLIVLQIIFGYLSFGYYGLIIGFVFSYLSGTIFSLNMWKDIQKYKETDNTLIKNKFFENIDQLKYSSTSIFINTISMSLIVFVIDFFYNSLEVGYYGMSLRILNIPITIISLSLSKLFMQQAHKDFKETGTFRNILKSFSVYLLITSLLFFLPMYVIPKEFIETILGKEWVYIITVFRILIPMYVIKLLVTTLSLSFIVINKQSLELRLQTLFLVSITTISLLTYLFNLTFEEFLYSFSMLFSICYLIYYYFIYKYA
ncbi:oligosaccharide flippase family protein [Macrococcoides caseolyticum]|uniref:oligosaccharide flippase family protein n=1 Tax=Macrococcoides caseolyticum TaxID=69966 RepID=UPI0030EF00C0